MGKPKVVTGKTVPQGGLQGYSHNALGLYEKAPKRFSEGHTSPPYSLPGLQRLFLVIRSLVELLKIFGDQNFV